MTKTSKISLIVCLLVTMAHGLGHWAYPLPLLNVVIHYAQPPIESVGSVWGCADSSDVTTWDDGCGDTATSDWLVWRCNSTDVRVSDCIVSGSTMDMTFEGCR